MRAPNAEFSIHGRKVGGAHPTFFIADIAANHDGDLRLAIDLIHFAAEAGADAAKFQHFQAATIVSDVGFRTLDRTTVSHQAAWSKSVFETYEEASLNPDWTPALKDACDKAGIVFFTTPYSHNLVDSIDPFVPAYKIGSGDVTWPQFIKYVAMRNKPVIIACGAANLDETRRAVSASLEVNPDTALLQCNTNYTGSRDNFKYVNLNVLKTFQAMYPGMIVGLSDHTPGHAAVLGAVALGGRIIEKHFTDDCSRSGPDHGFSLDKIMWREMVARTRELEEALGDGTKKVEDNEKQTVVVQRRALRATRDLPAKHVIAESDIVPLRPCPSDGIPPYSALDLIGEKLDRPLKAGEHFRWTDLE